MRFVILIKTFVFLVFAGQTYAGEEFTIYRVQYRAPEELIRVASAMLGPQAAFSSMGEKIVINGSPAATKAALDLFKELDRKPRSYRVSVRRRSRAASEDEGIGAEAEAVGGRVVVRKRSREGHGPGGVTAQVGGVGISAGVSQTASATSDGNSVQVMEGGEARLATGNTLFPSGMWVRPRPLGKGQVQLELYSRQAKKGLEMESASTTVQVPLGQWTSIGGVSKRRTESRGEILGKGSAAGSSDNDLRVLVEEIP